MNSIRLSLMVYFLLLLGLALGAVGGLLYWTTAQSVQAKKEAARTLILAQYEEQRRQEEGDLEQDLLAQARMLASMARVQFQYSRARYQRLYSLGTLTAVANPQGHLLIPLWLAEGTPGRLSEHLVRMSVTEIQFDEDDLVQDAENQASQYFQINNDWGHAWRSRSMGDLIFPFDAQMFDSNRSLAWRFDEAELIPGLLVKRVTLKSPVARVRFLSGPGYSHGRWPDRPRTNPGSDSGSSPTRPALPPRPPSFGDGPVRPGSPSRPPAYGDPWDVPAMSIYVQCATELDRLEAALVGLRNERDQGLARLDEESEATLQQLRNRLLWISLTTFAVTLVGGFALVRLGLAPLHRLTDAVSQVSERDFRLPLEDAPLPQELQPIVERLTQTLAMLKRAFAREKQAAADISHELRTPLAALMTTLEVGLRKTRSPEEYRELLADCRAAGQQMAQLVERLLTLARLDAGVDPLRPQKVDLTALAEQCAALVRPLAEARGLSLNVRCDQAASLTGDPDKLREVVTNLLHNAIEYNRPDGQIDLAVQRVNGHVEVAVRDTGIGIAPEDRHHIFERFYRADPSRQAEGLHAGLGLSIVKGYVDLMGGNIDLESQPGVGSTFRVQLPA